MTSAKCRYALIWVFILSTGNVSVAENLPLKTVVASYEWIDVTRVFDGVVESKYQSTVSSQTAGQVADIFYDVDDVVPEGEIILRIDDSEQQARLLEAKANVKNVVVLQREAKDEFTRMSNLAQKKLVSQAELDRTRTQLEAAQARYEQMQAQLSLAKRHLDYTVVKAPYSGVVVARHVQIGESVQVGQSLLTGFSLADLRVVTSIPSDIVSHIRTQGEAVISAPAIEDIRATGNEITVFPYADGRTHNFKVRVNLPVNIIGLYPGNFVKAAFTTGRQARLLIPRTAVAQRSEVKGVYVIDPAGGTLSFRYVVSGKPYGNMLEILSGLKEGERVALDPVAAAFQLKTERGQ